MIEADKSAIDSATKERWSTNESRDLEPKTRWVPLDMTKRLRDQRSIKDHDWAVDQ